MSLVTVNSVFNHTVIDDVDHAQTIAGFGPQAEERMRGVLTQETDGHSDLGVVTYLVERNRGNIYDRIVDGDDPWTSGDKDRLKRAETLYAFAESMPQLNLDLADGGGFVQSTGWDQSRTQYRRESEIAESQAGIKTQAIRLARGLLSRHDREDPSPVYVL